jgi:hypothetical protein
LLFTLWQDEIGKETSRAQLNVLSLINDAQLLLLSNGKSWSAMFIWAMRRLDLYPKRKLRNPARHLRSLERWSETIHEHFQDRIYKFDDDKYWNIKLPVYSKLCNPPHTTPKIQAACISALILAAQNIRAKATVWRPYKLAILFETPFLFNSEVTLFFDTDYLKTFFPPTVYGSSENENYRSTTAAPEYAQYEALQLQIPTEFEFLGGYNLRELDKEFPDDSTQTNRWVIVEK